MDYNRLGYSRVIDGDRERPIFVTGHSHNAHTTKKILGGLRSSMSAGPTPGIQWRKVINEYVADYSV